MRVALVIGILLIALGIVAMGYQSITFFTHERAVDAGPLQIDVKKPHTIIFNPLLGLAALAGGVVLILSARRADAP